MNTYNMQMEDANEEYKQDLGFKKMLYKYQHENQQLKNQIRALTERLGSILQSKQEDASSNKKSAPSQSEAHQKFWNDQLTFYYRRIEQVSTEIKNSKEAIDAEKEQQSAKLSNELKDKIKQLNKLKAKIQKYETAEFSENKPDIDSTLPVSHSGQTQQEKIQVSLTSEIEEVKKRIRDLQKTRNNKQKQDINRHMQMVNLQVKTRKISNEQLSKIELIEDSPKKGGLWGLELTQQNYHSVRSEFEQLKKEKNNLLASINIENNNLRSKLTKLKNQYIDLSTNSMNISLQLENATVPKNTKEIMQLATPKHVIKSPLLLPDIPLGPSSYERRNDKNYVEKKIKVLEWSSPSLNSKKNVLGFKWNDQNCKSPITGINLWLDKYLIGLQFIHTLSESTQHLHIEGNPDSTKKLIPIQYRLNKNDYLENVILIINNSTKKVEIPLHSIVGVQLISKSGRKDTFGFKAGTAETEKYDFMIKSPEKPIYSMGGFTINGATHFSCINKLCFAVI